MAEVIKPPLEEMKGMVKVSLHTFERVWATPLGGDKYRMENTSTIFRLDYGDEIIAHEDPERPGLLLWHPRDMPIVRAVFEKGHPVDES